VAIRAGQGIFGRSETSGSEAPPGTAVNVRPKTAQKPAAPPPGGQAVKDWPSGGQVQRPVAMYLRSLHPPRTAQPFSTVFPGCY
jgi:hypothetical protein